MKQGKIKEAEQAYRTAVQIEPGFYQSYYNLGVILYESGRANEAKECFNKVEAIYPGYEQTRHYLGK
jgi:tetratricopeptide (TPR) repeat protein